MTGDAKYVELAWARISASFLRVPAAQLHGNYSRESFIQYVLMYDWLYTGLTTERRTEFLDHLNLMAETVLTNKYSTAYPIRAADSDQMTGDYFGLASLYAVTHEYNPKIEELWARPYVGGFTPTPGDAQSFRDVIYRYVTELAKGGEWIESEAYNLGTVKLLVLGAEMIRTATGRDYFPEVTQLVPQLALRSIHRMTPDLKQVYQWGDEEHPRELKLYYRVETAMVLAGLTQSDPDVGPYVQDLVLSLVEKYGPTGYGSAEPWPRGFLVYNPYARRASRAELPKASYAEGMGMLQYRTGWEPSSSLFSAHFPPVLGVDHAPSYFGEFQLYRDGEWAVTHPLTYGGPGYDDQGTNSMLIGGLPSGYSSFIEFRRTVATDTSDDFAFIAGTTGGRVAAKGSWNPPPTFLREWTRSIFYVPALDAIVVHDRVDSDDPRRLPMGGYRAAVANVIRAIPALKEWRLHATAQPRAAGDAVQWDLPSGEPVRLHALLPQDRQITILNEKELWPGKSVVASEKAFTVRVTPASDRPWDTFLNVIQVGGADVAASIVRSEGGEAEGVALAGPRGERLILLFNARPGAGLAGEPFSAENAAGFEKARLMRQPFTVALESSWSPATVYALHLDPALSWSVNADGGSVSWNRRDSGVVAVKVTGPGGSRLTFRP